MAPSSRHPSRTHPAVTARRQQLLTPFGRQPFTTAAALAAGLTASDLRSQTVTPIFRGVYAAGRNRRIDHGLRCAAAGALVGGDAWVASVDAARLLGLPVGVQDRPWISVTGPLRGRRLQDIRLCRRQEGVTSTGVWVPSADRVLLVTHPVDVVAEAAQSLGFVDAVALADAVLNTAPDPRGVLSRWHAESGVAASRMRRIADLATPGAGSAMETQTRMLLVLGGFPRPVVQHPVRLGGSQYVLDLAYPQLRIGIEYDGSYHYASEAQKHKDIRRSEAFSQEGWDLLHVVSRGIYRDPLGTLRRADALFRSRGVLVRPSDEWTRYFVQHDPPGTAHLGYGERRA